MLLPTFEALSHEVEIVDCLLVSHLNFLVGQNHDFLLLSLPFAGLLIVIRKARNIVRVHIKRHPYLLLLINQDGPVGFVNKESCVFGLLVNLLLLLIHFLLKRFDRAFEKVLLPINHLLELERYFRNQCFDQISYYESRQENRQKDCNL